MLEILLIIYEKNIMIKNITIGAYILLSVLGGSKIYAQNGSGSSFLDNGSKKVSAGTSEVIYSERLYIGPDAEWKMDGDLYVYSKQVWIAPTAKLTGTGKIIFKDPGVNPYYQGWGKQATLIDGNGGDYIAVNIVIDNPSNIQLANIQDPGFGIGGNTANNADLRVASNIDFNVAGGDILLNGSTLYLGEQTQLLNAGSEKYLGQYVRGFVVTGNNPASMLVKAMKLGERFLFPVGTNEDSYSPAILKPTQAVNMQVGVVDYAAAGLVIENPNVGMDRIWKILGDREMRADYTLVHNSLTNGTAFVDSRAEIMQYAGGDNWIGDVTQVESQGVHTREKMLVSAIQTAEAIWATKFSISGPVAVDDQFILAYADRYPNNENVFNILLNDLAEQTPIVASSVEIVARPLYGTVTVNSDGTVTYTPQHGFVGEDTFEYRITDLRGKTSTAKVRVEVTPRDIFIPNVFTPNGDGHNDYFHIVGYENYDYIKLIVVNRWGNEVYRQDRYDNRWDGRGLNEGTYFYIIEAVKGGNKRVFKGDVLIKRQ